MANCYEVRVFTFRCQWLIGGGGGGGVNRVANHSSIPWQNCFGLFVCFLFLKIKTKLGEH